MTNPITCENSLPGNPSSEWDILGWGDASIQGFATEISVNRGETVGFKVKTNASSYRLDIYRIGYYGGQGARKVATVAPSVPLPQSQPLCIDQGSATGLVDCGNWAQSASWTVPESAVSGVYIAKLVRTDNGGSSHIIFVVRDDASASAMLFQTADTTWQAYNSYGDKASNQRSLYDGPNGRAVKVSYNRPFRTRSDTPGGRDFFFANEYPMVRWLEANGYDVTYTTGVDSDRRGALIRQHRLFLSVGHDEYWSGSQRANVEAARDAGVHLAFFGGNSVYWKSRWENSVDASGAPYRTLVSYKETKANAKIDPDPAWTGTWRDPRFSPPADGGRPENALMGTLYQVNTGEFAIKVPEADGKMRLWRNTTVADLLPGQTATLAPNTLGYEWDEDRDNGFRPAGLVRMSTTTETVTEYLYDYGSTVGPGVATHHLTLYKAPSGALVFGAGTIQWAWGLDENHDGQSNPPDARMQQATVNLFADMGVQPATLMPGLTPAVQTTDTTSPTATITSPSSGATLSNGSTHTVTGTAADVGGRVGGVEVSTDGGSTWHPAAGRESWSYTWSVTGVGSATIRARATDDSGNIQPVPASVQVDVTCPCTIFGNSATPKTAATNDANPIEVGVKFRADVDSWITGVRFYKGTGNTGAHVGKLWTSTGTLLASATFTGETATGWQQVTFSEAVPISANTTYIASYFAPNGKYAADSNFFLVDSTHSPPLRALRDGVDGGNGVYLYGGAGFPSQTYGSSNYWVDAILTTTPPPDTNPPTATATAPPPDAFSIPANTQVKATFSEPVQPGTISFVLRDPAGDAVPSAVTYDGPSRAATLTPSTSLAGSTTYTATVNGAQDLAGNAMAASLVWSFRTATPPSGICPCSIWDDTVVPSVRSAADSNGAELGVKFQAEKDGFVDGIRFYKGPGNTGTHTGSLWTANGALLATATFSGEGSEGWQQVSFAAPVAVTANTTYVASYYAPNGRYAADANYFAATGVNNSPLRALANGEDPNGVYVYGGGFPSQTFGAANYWVDVVFRAPPDLTPPSVVGTSPGANATSVPTASKITASFNEPVQPPTISFTVRDAADNPVAATQSYDGASKTATLTPTGGLAAATRYTATVSGATDAAGNVQTEAVSWSFTTSGVGACPCSIFSSSSTPSMAASGDTNAAELGVRFQADVDGYLLGIRFFKGEGNSGPHVGTLWSASGAQLASATFTSETPTGWQQVMFGDPVAVTAGSTYVASYHAPAGRYAGDGGYFAVAAENPPLLASANGAEGPNGVYLYGPGGFPTQTFNATNYWVDVVFDTVPPPDLRPPTVASTEPLNGASSVLVGSAVNATFDEPVQPASISFTLRDASNTLVPASVNYDAGTRTATLQPTSQLAGAADYTATISGASDLAGNTMVAPVTWSFRTAATAPPPGTCPCSLWSDHVAPNTPAASDTSAVEVGVKIRADADGFIYGIRFYKGAGNSGTHTGSLWSATGARLATATFTSETTTGWQQALFDTPVAITAGTTYVASYYAPNGRYAVNSNYFTTAFAAPPLRALANGFDGGNGVYRYGAGGGFPTQSSGAPNYWVDAVFNTVGDTTAPSIASRSPAAGATAVALDARVTATFNEAVAAGSIDFTLRDAANNVVSGSVAYDNPTRSATFTPANYLAQNTTFTASARATDLAGNAMPAPDTWSFTTLADTAAPVISGVGATAAPNGTATITWATDEPSDSRVDYGTNPAALTVSATNGTNVLSHSLVLSGLSANATYYYRVTSKDLAGNAATSPALPNPPASFQTPPGTVSDRLRSDFELGTPGSATYVTETADGEVTLAPAVGAEFAGSSVPASWSTTAWSTGGTATVASGSLRVDGARTGTNATYGPGRSLEFFGTFGGASNQHVGFGVDYDTSNEWAMFSTRNGSGLFARSRTGNTKTDTPLNGIAMTAPHKFRIDWNPTNIVYTVDGTVVATHSIAVATAMRPLASDFTTGGASLSVNWLRMTPYPSAGAFTSRVLDAGATALWTNATWTADLPAGAGLTVTVRTGNTSTPDATWTAWAPVAGPGSAIAGSSRYLQYSVQLTTTSPGVTPALRDITFTYGT